MTFDSFSYPPTEYERERASNSYLMSLMALFVGLPLPIFNLLATILFYFGNKNSTHFVRWHCTQSLITQFSLFFLNSFTILCILTNLKYQKEEIFWGLIALIIFTVLINLTELIFTIISAIKIRKGVHVKWWIYGNITDKLCPK